MNERVEDDESEALLGGRESVCRAREAMLKKRIIEQWNGAECGLL